MNSEEKREKYIEYRDIVDEYRNGISWEINSDPNLLEEAFWYWAIEWVNLVFDNVADKADCYGMATSLFGEHGEDGFYDQYCFIFHKDEPIYTEGMRPYEIKEAEKKKSQEAARYQHIVERVGGIDVHDYKQSEFAHIMRSSKGRQIYDLVCRLNELAYPLFEEFAKYLNEHSKKYGEKLHIRKGNNYLKKVMAMLEQEK